MSSLVPIGQLPAYHARRDAGRAMLSQNGVTISRGQFEASTNRRARALARFGIGQGDVVVMAMPNSLDVFETSFALWKLGVTPLPVSASTPAAELQSILELVQPKAVIGLPGAAYPCTLIPKDLPIDETLSAEPVDDVLPRHWRWSLSGGSTGRPKIIVDTNPPLFDPGMTILGQRVDGTQLNAGPLYHSGPFGLSHLGLFAGGHVVNMDRFDPLEVLALVDRYQVDWLYLVPTMMNRIWRLPPAERLGFALTSLEVVIHTAAPCSPWLKENWIEWLGAERIWEFYTSSESVGRTMIRGTEWLKRKGSVGQIQPGAELAILDSEGRACAAGEVGEIYFKPLRGVSFEYLGAEIRTLNGWYSVGDMGSVDEEGYLYIADRRTDMIVSGGVNIYPAEIEAAIEAYPGVAGVVVIGIPDEDMGQRVHAIVQRDAASEADVGEESLRTFLGDRLVRYKLPKSFEFVTEPLRDAAGKVRRSALREERIANGSKSLMQSLAG